MKINFHDIVDILQGLILIFIAFLIWLGIYNLVLNQYISNLLLLVIIYVTVIFTIFYFVNRNRSLKIKFENKILFLGLCIIFFLSIVYKTNFKKLETGLSTSTKKSIFRTQKNKDSYINGDIKTKIRILKKLGFSKEKISEKLRNDMEFKELVKNGSKQFYMIYHEDSEKN